MKAIMNGIANRRLITNRRFLLSRVQSSSSSDSCNNTTKYYFRNVGVGNTHIRNYIVGTCVPNSNNNDDDKQNDANERKRLSTLSTSNAPTCRVQQYYMNRLLNRTPLAATTATTIPFLTTRFISSSGKLSTTSCLVTTTSPLFLSSTNTHETSSFGGGAGGKGLDWVKRFASTTSTTNTDIGNMDNADTKESSTSTRGSFQRRRTQAAQRGRDAARRGGKRAKELMRMYGPVFFYTYFGVYVMTLTGLFAGIDSGLIDPASIAFHGFGFGDGGEEAAAATATADAVNSYNGAGEDGADGGVPSEEINNGATQESTSSSSSLSTSDEDDSSSSNSTVQWIASLLEKWEWTAPYAEVVEKNPHVANFAVAWLATKTTEPIRLGFTVVTVPRIARYLGRVPPEVKKMEEQEKLEEVEEEAQNLQAEKDQETKEKMK